MYSVSFRGTNCLEYGLLPVRRPDIPAPELRITETEIPGRDGVLTESDGDYAPITISIEFNFMRSPDTWASAFRAAKKWLQGSGKLELSDDQDYFYRVYYCKIDDCERTSRKIGKFTAEFYCQPYMYQKDGEMEVENPASLYNFGAVSHPIYKITGEGMCTLTVNEKSMTANVGQNITIDTDAMLAYREDGTLQNTSVTGDYENLYLAEGDNTISVTDGFELTVIPNWREL